jgi:hypothetical protein
MGAEAFPGHEEIPSRRAPLRVFSHCSSPGKRHAKMPLGILARKENSPIDHRVLKNAMKYLETEKTTDLHFLNKPSTANPNH